jgi:hypothetical protein
MPLLLFLAGGVLLAGLVRWWRPEVSWRAAAAFLLLAGAFFAVPLATRDLQVPVDIAYQWEPWREMTARLQPGNALLSDVPLHMLPLRTLVRERLLHLQVPLWSHELGTGQPLAGNAQAAPFALLHLLALPLPPSKALSAAAAWQALLALLFTYALALSLGAGRAGAALSSGGRPGAGSGGGSTGAALAAIAYAFSSFAVAWAYYPLGMAAAWVPGFFLGLLATARRERGGVAGLAVCAIGLATSGHPETLAHASVAAAVLAAALLVRRRGDRAGFLRRTALAAALAVCLAAPALLPVVQAMPESLRTEVLRRAPLAVQPPPFRARILAPLVDPLVHGSPRDRNAGYFNWNEIASGYAGLLTLALALAAALAAGRRALAALAAGALALLVALRVPPWFQMMMALPVVGNAAHARLRLFWVLGLALAAGLGLDTLATRRRGRLAAGLLVAAAATALALLPPPDAPWERAWWWATLAGALAVEVALLVPRLRPAFPRLALVCVALDLALLGWRYNPIVARDLDLQPPPALAHLIAAAHGPEAPFRVTGEVYDMMPGLPAVYGLWDARGNDPMRPAAGARMVGRALVADNYRPGPDILQLRPDVPQGWQDYLGVRYFLARHRRHLPSPWEPVFDDQGGRVWRNPQALPLFFIPRAAAAAPRDEVVERAATNADFAALGFVEGATSPQRPQEGTVALRRVRPAGFDLDIASPTGGLVTSSVSDASGWRLEIDGRSAPLRRVNGGFLGFEVPPGSHRVRLDYRPIGWTLGLALAAMGGLAAVIAAWRSLWLRR